MLVFARSKHKIFQDHGGTFWKLHPIVAADDELVPARILSFLFFSRDMEHIFVRRKLFQGWAHVPDMPLKLVSR